MSGHILLVDDNQIQSTTRRAILESAGHEVKIALDGQTALDLLAEPETNIGLIITDHLMPVMSGKEFVTELRRQSSEIPVLVLSGLPDAEADYEGLQVIFRLKPLAPDHLIRLSNDLLGEDMLRSA
jgi:DNA-binding response OmpR family regulator